MNDVQKALELWVELTGFDPNATKYRSNEWHIRGINDELKEALVLDDTQLTTLMLLECFATEYLQERTFTVNEMIQDFDYIQKYLEKSKEIYSILQSEEITEKKEEFKNWIKEALEHYGVSNEKVYEMAQSSEALGFIRRDALRSMEKLEIHQFYQGESDNESVKYVTKVHEFWNINSLIKAMINEKTLSGVSLNLIRDPLDSSSYFAFAIRNGGTLSILTDKPNYSHPLQKYMSRRPGKNFSERMSKHHFPYDLLDIAFDSRGDAYVSTHKTTEMVIYQEELHSLKEIKELAPNEIIWIVMMFSLIKEKFWKQNFKTQELSYTGEMANRETLLTGAIAIQEKKGFLLPTLTSKDVETDKMLNGWDEMPTKKNEWLEERYKDKVTEEILNLVGNNTTVKLLLNSSEVTEMTVAEYKESTSFMNRYQHEGVTLQKFDPTIFGSKEEIVKNQRWIARYNKALVINNEAQIEFDERAKNIQDDYFNKVKANIDFLFSSIAKGVLEAPAVVRGINFGDEESYQNKNILNLHLVRDRSTLTGNRTFKLSRYTNHEDLCYVTGGKPEVVALFRPTTVEALALMCGCRIEDFPDVLQYWSKKDLYSGNEILSNVDPMEWALEDPWKKMNLEVEVFLSKTAYNQLRKKEGLAPNKFWLKGG